MTLDPNFDPVITFGGGSTGITYSFKQGDYSLLANGLQIAIRLVLTSKGTDTGDAHITGLPRASNGGYSNFVVGTSLMTNTTNYTYFGARVEVGDSELILFEGGSGQAMLDLTEASFDNATEIYISGYYYYF